MSIVKSKSTNKIKKQKSETNFDLTTDFLILIER